MSLFFTQKKSELGTRIALKYPNGMDSPEWIEIRGVHSDVFRDADNQMRRDLMVASSITEKDQKEAQFKELQLKLVASLVKGWSFPEPCTLENVIFLFKEAPQIMDQVDLEASKKSNFFGVDLKSLESSLSKSSDLTSDPTPLPVPPSDNP